MFKKLTSFTCHTTGEGMRITFTYSVIDEGGNVTKSNQRASLIALDKNALEAVAMISDFLADKIPE